MNLAERVRADLGTAMKAKDEVRVSALRMLLSAFKNAEIEKRGPLTDEDALGQVQKAIKMRREAADGAAKAGRADVKAREEAEAKVLEGYLPAQLGDAELDALVAATVTEAGAAGPADMGKVMKLLMPKIAGKADGAKASAAVRKRLAGS